MVKRRRRAGREGESLFVILALLAYCTYEKLIEYPLLTSLIFGLIASLIIISTLLILRARRVRKANLLAKESFYNDYTPIEFEHLTAEIYRQLGFKADVTPPSGDKGLDVLLFTSEDKIGVQCKKFQVDIGPAYIREFAGALEGAKISQGIFVTSSDFTDASKEAAKNSQSKITLINGEQLGELRIRAEKRINTDLIPKRWWSILPSWQKAVLIALLILCVMLIVSTITYTIIYINAA